MIEVPSFSIDHTVLNPGLYLRERRNLSDSDEKCFLYIWDLRFVPPTGNHNSKFPWPPLSSAVLHTIEHLMAYKLRYLLGSTYVGFYPMGCRTGFTFTTKELSPYSLAGVLIEAIGGTIPILEKSEVPALSFKECGNPKSYNLQGATTALANYKQVLEDQFPDLKTYIPVI